MLQDVSLSHVKETFENWSIFETVIRHNYMCHNELVSGLKAIAAELANHLRIIDLGCGDAWLATHAFHDAQPDAYLGVDLSESAIERARKAVAPWGTHAKVCCGNIATFVQTLADGSTNLILASNSIHHFDSDSKIKIAQHCFRILMPHGVFCWIDPVRNEDETREVYLRRLTNVMQEDWTALSEDQRRTATQHVWDSDFPETANWMQQQIERAGFQPGGRFLQTDLFGAWKFVKP